MDVGTLERRRAYRVRLCQAEALCSVADSGLGLYSVLDLSSQGVRIEGRPLLPLGAQVELMLRLPGFDPLVVDGYVARAGLEVDRPRLGVLFKLRHVDHEAIIEAVLASELLRQSGPVVVVIDSSDEDCRLITSCLLSLGFCTVRASTPLDAIQAIEHSKDRIRAIVLGSSVGQLHGLDVASFLAADYPGVRRVLVASPSWRIRREAAGRVHAVVHKPWTEQLMRQALEVTERRPEPEG